MSWQGRVLTRVLKGTLKNFMFSGRPTPVRMGLSAVALELSAGLVPVPRATITPHKTLRGEWVEADNPGRAVILYLHGGAYIAGSPRTHRPLTAELARRAGARVLALDYRQAPQHEFPAWMDDAVGAYRALLDEGFAPGQIVIAGDSAGGNLALVTLLRLRELKLPLPAGAVCLSPWTELTCSYKSHTVNARHEAMLNPRGLKALGLRHIGPHDPKNPLLSPAHADLAGLPPLMVHVGTTEILLDDARAIRRNAKRAGIRLVYREWREMPHVFPLFHLVLPEGRKALEQIADFVKDLTR
ncbi:MAG TPA: alpha/beta hydrolase [Moraxellaceae bacterium]|nr:alpha/beta hydrolase [Moraxellaceae bacterium]